MTIEPIFPQDVATMAAIREATAAHKGEILGPAARPMFDAMLTATPVPSGVRVENATLNGIPGIWCLPDNARREGRVLYLHGGGYMLGSAQAFIHFASQIAARAGADTFVADYRLAPEHPFPAAIDDSVAAYHGVWGEHVKRVAVVGDSAGGGLTLALLSILAATNAKEVPQPACASVMSPWTDLALTGASLETRAGADPYFTRPALQAFASAYLRDRDPTDPKASPLHGHLNGLPPIRIDVGNDEVLLDDSVRFAERARAAGTEVNLSVWTGMPHVFQSSLDRFVAAERSLQAMGNFLVSHLSRSS